MKIAITGGAGLIGTILRKGLEDPVTTLDVRTSEGVRTADSADVDALVEAFRGHDAVVDLAADSRVDAAWESVLRVNIPACRNALEAARLAGVKRVVFASSNHVTGLFENDEPYRRIVAGELRGLAEGSIPMITADGPIRPDGPYAIGKALGETAGRFYSERHGLSVLCLRVGTVNRENRPRNSRECATLLTHEDLVRLVDRCIRAPERLRFGIYYGVSANTWRFWDLDRARREIGFLPRDDAERWRPAAR